MPDYERFGIEKLTPSGANEESRSLGGFYALGTITIVSVNAANALPWLYESFLTQQSNYYTLYIGVFIMFRNYNGGSKPSKTLNPGYGI